MSALKKVYLMLSKQRDLLFVMILLLATSSLCIHIISMRSLLRHQFSQRSLDSFYSLARKTLTRFSSELCRVKEKLFHTKFSHCSSDCWLDKLSLKFRLDTHIFPPCAKVSVEKFAKLDELAFPCFDSFNCIFHARVGIKYAGESVLKLKVESGSYLLQF